MRFKCTPSDYDVICSPSLDHHDFWFYLSGLGVGNAWDVHINIVGEPDKNNAEKLTENQERIMDLLYIQSSAPK